MHGQVGACYNRPSAGACMIMSMHGKLYWWATLAGLTVSVGQNSLSVGGCVSVGGWGLLKVHSRHTVSE